MVLAIVTAVVICGTQAAMGQGLTAGSVNSANPVSAQTMSRAVPVQSRPTAGASVTPEAVPGYILVEPRPGLPEAEFNGIVGAHGGKSIGRIGSLDIHVVMLPPEASEQAVANALRQNPHIKFAEPDAIVPSAFVPNDVYYPNEWHLQTIGAPAAWDIARGSGITVAVLDSGIDPAHPDLASQLVPGWNFWDNNSNTTDVYGHGTKVAGVIGAIGNNSNGVAGVAHNARLMPIRVTDTSGSASISALASGLSYAADHGARVANMSFAVQSYSTVISAAQYFMNKGGVVMNSAGNYATLDPSAASGALVTVSATDGTDALASFSSYGPYVDLAAPGVSIWTTTSGGGYGAVSGTSFSSPLTAGVAALVMSANPGLSGTQVISLLESTARDLGAAGEDNYFGYGRVDAAAAVTAAIQGVATDKQAPSASIVAPTGGTVSGIVPVDVTASDNVGVSRVELLVNGTLLASDTLAPYGFSWDSSAFAGKSVSLIAKAYDAAGNVGSSSPITVTVSNPTALTGTSVNVALSANGGVATASSVMGVAQLPANMINNERSGAGLLSGGGGWADADAGVFPDWVQINFDGQKTLDHVVVYSVQDNFLNPVEPTDTMTFTRYGLTSFSVQGWNGASWVTLGSVSGNTLIKRTVSFSPYTTDRIRIVVTAVADNLWSRITEIEAWGY